MKRYKVIIIGAGASGCMCALKSKEKRIAIIDTVKTLAKKIMVTGNGRCNLTNIKVTSSNYNQNIDKFLQKFNENDTIKFFESFGLETYADDEGRVYPISNSAKSVVDVINLALQKKIDFISEQTVLDVKKSQNEFLVRTNCAEFVCEKLVVASGGGSLFDLIERLGGMQRKTIPSLVSLKSKNVTDLNGVKVSNVGVTEITEKGTTKSEIGEVLFKENGLSGIVIFNLSALFAREAKFKGQIKIDLLPNTSEHELIEKLTRRKALSVKMDKFFVGMFQNAISNQIFMQSKFNTNKNSANITDNDIKLLAKTIKELCFSVDGCYENNQVFSGGVKLSELDENLMCKKIPNLYFTGEVCDVDGVCGGYNLQWAWTSGAIVGDSL